MDERYFELCKLARDYVAMFTKQNAAGFVDRIIPLLVDAIDCLQREATEQAEIRGRLARSVTKLYLENTKLKGEQADATVLAEYCGFIRSFPKLVFGPPKDEN